MSHRWLFRFRRPRGVRALGVLLLGTSLLGAACKKEDPPPPPDGGVNRSERLEACVILEACGHTVIDSLATSIICADDSLAVAFGLRGPIEDLVECILAAVDTADTCASTALCLNLGQLPTPCTTGRGCEGEVIVECSAGGTTAFDCTAAGQACTLDADSSPTCGYGTCDPMFFVGTCIGDIIELCANGVIAHTDCSSSGRTCIEDPIAPFCGGSGDPCDPVTFEEHCDGDTALFCDANAIGSLNCADFSEGQTCVAIDAFNVTCAPTASDCTPIVDDACNGDDIVLCVENQYWTYDCLSLGFATCALDMDEQPFCTL